jgi:hypothetical protein
VQVTFTTAVSNTTLAICFDRPLQAPFEVALKALSDQLTDAVISDDHKTVTFGLKHPLTARAFRSGNAVVLDLGPASAQSATSAAAARASAATAPVGPVVPVRTGVHEGYDRLVFDWPNHVGYTLARDGDTVVLTFDQAAQVNLDQAGKLDRRHLLAIDQATQDGHLTLRLTCRRRQRCTTSATATGSFSTSCAAVAMGRRRHRALLSVSRCRSFGRDCRRRGTSRPPARRR